MIEHEQVLKNLYSNTVGYRAQKGEDKKNKMKLETIEYH